VKLQACLAALAIFLLGAAAAPAQDADVDCDNAMTQMEMNYCASLDLEEADATLNALWPEVVAKAKAYDADMGDIYADRGVPSSFEALRTAQRAWIEYRDRQCEYEAYEVFGGTMQPMVGTACEARLTEERNAFFRDILTGSN
jgi:uncharacterized protein YecT (DUF1311 family)